MNNPIIKTILFILGVLSVIVGVIGIVVPLLPTTPFLILAAWLFLKSSKEAHDWLYRQPVIGEALSSWQKTKSISKKNKIYAIFTIFLSITLILYKPIHLVIKTGVILFLCFIIIFIYSRPSK